VVVDWWWTWWQLWPWLYLWRVCWEGVGRRNRRTREIGGREESEDEKNRRHSNGQGEPVHVYAQGLACARHGGPWRSVRPRAMHESPTCAGLQVLPENDEAAHGVWPVEDRVEDFDNVASKRNWVSNWSLELRESRGSWLALRVA
jgi:hypothetical protein